MRVYMEPWKWIFEISQDKLTPYTAFRAFAVLTKRACARLKCYESNMRNLIFLAVAICSLSACSYEKPVKAMIAANVFAMNTANALSAYLAENKMCPKELNGWSFQRKEFIARIGSGDDRYPLSLECFSDLEFNIVVKYSFDSGTWVTGSFEGKSEISYGHFTELKHITFDKDSDVRFLAEKVVHRK